MKHVYIVLSQTGTLFSRIIRRFTGDKYNHSAIAFHKDLNVMYSFGRKHPINVFYNGFVEENFHTGVLAHFPGNTCRVMELSVTDREYEAMLSELSKFLSRKSMYSYNLLGLTGFMTGLPLRFKDSYFCSQFVSHILHKTMWWHKCDDFVKPMDFAELGTKIYEGRAKDYDYTKLPVYDTIPA